MWLIENTQLAHPGFGRMGARAAHFAHQGGGLGVDN
jgi:hypothetical protein